MELVDAGKINLNEKLTYGSRHYYGGSGNIQFEKVGSTYTIRELVRRSIAYSDNIAFIMLNEKVGRQNTINYMKKLGGTYTYPQGKSITSAWDLSIYATKLYNYAQKNENGKELVKYLKSTIYNTHSCWDSRGGSCPQGWNDSYESHL